MASAYEVRLVAGKVKSAYSEIDRRRSSVFANAKDSANWWHGAASDSFSLDYKKINDDIHALLDVYTELEKQLKAVANAIDAAEAAAKAEAEARAKAKADA